MNSFERLKNMVINSPDLLACSGSRLYGTNRDDSDWDFRGFILPSFEYLIGIKHFDDMDIEGADHKVFSLKRYLDLVLKGDPSLTEILFVPKDKIVKISPIGEKIIAIRSSLVSNAIFNKVLGYSTSEWRKAMGERMIIEGRTKDEDDIVAWIRDAKKWDKERMDTFVEWINEDKPKKIVPSTRDFGAKRKAEVEKYGFGVSSAAHSIRLVGEIMELMTTGNITFPRPNASILKDIRYGKYTREEVQKIRDDIEKEVNEARKKSILSDKPDYKLVYNVYGDIVREVIK